MRKELEILQRKNARKTRDTLRGSFCNYSFSLSRKRSFFVEEIMGRNDDDNQRLLLLKESISSLLSEYFSHHADVLEFVNSLTELCFLARTVEEDDDDEEEERDEQQLYFYSRSWRDGDCKSDSPELRPRDEGTGDVREVDGTVSLRCCLL